MANAIQPSAVTPLPEEALFLDLMRTVDLLSRGPARLLKSHHLSATQYNVLRILRGSPDGLPCGEISDRMISRDPDITRLLDRLERRGLIGRCRQQADRRMIVARITPAGLALLEKLDGPVRALHRHQLGHLCPNERRQFTSLLEKARRSLF